MKSSKTARTKNAAHVGVSGHKDKFMVCEREQAPRHGKICGCQVHMTPLPPLPSPHAAAGVCAAAGSDLAIPPDRPPPHFHNACCAAAQQPPAAKSCPAAAARPCPIPERQGPKMRDTRIHTLIQELSIQNCHALHALANTALCLRPRRLLLVIMFLKSWLCLQCWFFLWLHVEIYMPPPLTATV